MVAHQLIKIAAHELDGVAQRVLDVQSSFSVQCERLNYPLATILSDLLGHCVWISSCDRNMDRYPRV